MGLGALTTVDAVLDRLLGIVPGTAGVGHEDGQQLADDDHARQIATQRCAPRKIPTRIGIRMARQRRADQLALGRGRADGDHPAVIGLLGPCPDLLVAELNAAFLDDQECCTTHRSDQHRAEQERHHAADQGTDEDLGICDRELASLDGVLLHGHLADLVFAADGHDRDEAREQAHRRDDRTADRDSLGLGLGGVAHGVKVGQDLAARL